MARTKRAEGLARYRAELEQEKAAYLKATGKKIARGFKDTPQYKRIERNRRQFLYRLEKAKDEKQAGKLAELLPPPGRVNVVIQGEDNKLGQYRASNDEDGIFWKVLTNRAENENSAAVQAFREYEMGQGKPVRGIVKNDVNGGQQLYFSETTFLQGLRRLYRESAEYQDKIQDSGRPFVSVSTIETDTAINIVVRSYDPGQPEEGE